ncbi:MAG: CHASE4 domain-containing protein [Geminicoccaceae bacterium]
MLLVVAVVVAATGVVVWNAHKQDEIAIEDSEHLGTTAVDTRYDRTAGLIREYAVWDEADQALGGDDVDLDWADSEIAFATGPTFPAKWAFLVDDQGRTRYAGHAGERSDATAAGVIVDGLSNLVARLGADNMPVSATVLTRDGPALASIGRVAPHTATMKPTKGPPSYLVFVDPIDQEWLKELSAAYLLPDLRLVDPKENVSPRVVLADAEGIALAGLT